MDMFDTRTMLGMVTEGNKDATTFLRDRYFKNRRTFSTTKIDIDIVGAGDRKIAPFVNPKIGGVVVDRQGYKTNTYEAPEIAPMRVTTAEELLKRSAGEALYSGKTPEERAAEQLGKDLSDLDDLITRREEAMCAEALFSGSVTIKGEGYDEVINYWGANIADQPTTTLGAKWDAEAVNGGDIMSDLRSIRRGMIQKAGITPSEIVCGTDVIDVLVDKLAAAGALDNRRVDLGQINPQMLPNGVTYWGYLKDSALDIYSYDSWYVNAEGVEVPFVPANKVLLGSPKVATTLAYGLVSLTGEDIKFFEGARVPDSWVQRVAPAGRIVQLKSRPLPIVHQIHGFHVVDATTQG
jgi:hypothetical protein